MKTLATPDSDDIAQPATARLSRGLQFTRRVYGGVARALDEFITDEAEADMETGTAGRRSSAKSLARASAPEQTSRSLCRTLNQSLADCVDLQLQCRQAGWTSRAEGADASLCRLFEEIACALSIHAAAVAEEIGRLGGIARATLADVSERSGLGWPPTAADSAQANVDAVAAALGVVSASVAHDLRTLAPANDARVAQPLHDIACTADHYRECLAAYRV